MTQLTLFRRRKDRWIKRVPVQSQDSQRFYTLGFDTDGNIGCTCRHWIYQKGHPAKRPACKHIRKWREES